MNSVPRHKFDDEATNKHLRAFLKTLLFIGAGFLLNLALDLIFIVVKHAVLLPRVLEHKGIPAFFKAYRRLLFEEIWYGVLIAVLTLFLVLFFSIRAKLPVAWVILAALCYAALWFFIHGHCYQWMYCFVISIS